MKLQEAANKKYSATITGCKSAKAWYADKVGESFEVVANTKFMVWAVAEDIENGISDRLIEPEDCVISETNDKRPVCDMEGCFSKAEFYSPTDLNLCEYCADMEITEHSGDLQLSDYLVINSGNETESKK
jgi:hypothetical protein